MLSQIEMEKLEKLDIISFIENACHGMMHTLFITLYCDILDDSTNVIYDIYNFILNYKVDFNHVKTKNKLIRKLYRMLSNNNKMEIIRVEVINLELHATEPSLFDEVHIDLSLIGLSDIQKIRDLGFYVSQIGINEKIREKLLNKIEKIQATYIIEEPEIIIKQKAYKLLFSLGETNDNFITTHTDNNGNITESFVSAQEIINIINQFYHNEFEILSAYNHKRLYRLIEDLKPFI